ncbi:MAG: phospholipase D-like domain-containing protein [Opitutaceae bacterium]
MHTLYLKSIADKWRRAVKKSEGQVVVLSPYLTSRTADSVIERVEPKRCRIYTVFSIEAFASKASSLPTIRRLHDAKYSIYHLPKLHAKIVYVEGEFASIGSQNVTRGGTQNTEASVAFTEIEDLEQIDKSIQQWSKDALLVSEKMILEAEAKVAELQVLFDSFKIHAKDIDTDIFQNESKRIEQLVRKRERAKARRIRKSAEASPPKNVNSAESIEVKANRLKAKIQAIYQPLTEYSGISRELAAEAIKYSAEWDHPRSYGYVSAPGHSSNIYDVGKAWRVDFGANTFNISRAIIRSAKVIIGCITKNPAQLDLEQIRKKIEFNVTCSVSSANGREYTTGYSNVVDRRLVFGTQAINLESFSLFMIIQCQLRIMLYQLERLES